jgi:hypothetical protein
MQEKNKFEVPTFEQFINNRNCSSYERLSYELYGEYIHMANIVWRMQNSLATTVESQHSFNDQVLTALTNLGKVGTIHNTAIKVQKGTVSSLDSFGWVSSVLHLISLTAIAALIIKGMK